MSNPAKAKGTAWETAIVRAIAAFADGRHGIEPRRVAQTGREDTGDLHGLDPFVVQAKAYRNLTDGIREGVDGAIVQARRAGRDIGVAFVKRPRKPVGDGYAVMRISDWTRLLVRLRSAEARLAAASPTSAIAHHDEVVADRDRPF
jgi:hypothetical protein